MLCDPHLGIAVHKLERGLSLLPCLQTVEDPSGLLTQQFRPFLRRLRESGEWDTIIIDTPPVLAVTDTLVIAPQVSGMVVVVNTGSTNRRSLVSAVDNLTRIGAKVLGLAINQLRSGEGSLVSSEAIVVMVVVLDLVPNPLKSKTKNKTHCVPSGKFQLPLRFPQTRQKNLEGH